MTLFQNLRNLCNLWLTHRRPRDSRFHNTCRPWVHLLCLLPILATAQAKGTRTCRLLFLGAPDGAPEKLHLFDGTTSQEVELPQMNLSPVYQLVGGPLVLRLLPAAPAKPEDVSSDAPKVALPEAVTDCYLLVSSDPTNKIAPVKLQVIDADPAKFTNGQMLWFNLTPNQIGGKIGDSDLAMTANSRKILDAPASANEDYNVNLSFRMPGNERLYPLCETKWQHDTRSRTVVFVVIQEGTRTPRVLGFPDYRKAAPKSEKP